MNLTFKKETPKESGDYITKFYPHQRPFLVKVVIESDGSGLVFFEDGEYARIPENAEWSEKLNFGC